MPEQKAPSTISGPDSRSESSATAAVPARSQSGVPRSQAEGPRCATKQRVSSGNRHAKPGQCGPQAGARNWEPAGSATRPQAEGPRCITKQMISSRNQPAELARCGRHPPRRHPPHPTVVASARWITQVGRGKDKNRRPQADGPKCVTKQRHFSKRSQHNPHPGGAVPPETPGLFAALIPPRAAEEPFAFWSPFRAREDCF